MKTPKIVITNAILARIAEIENCRSEVQGYVLLPEREAELRYRATVENTHSSVSIEGNPLSDRQVAAVLKDRGGEPLTRHRYAEIEVKNYKKALDFVEKRKLSGVAMGVEDALEIHRILMEGLLPEEKVGRLREREIYIVNQDDEVVYTGAPANTLGAELEELFDWLAKVDVHPCIAAGIFHLFFIAIHPFADGNGRTTRLLTLLFLGLKKYDFNGSLTLDNFYAEDRGRYYAELEKAHGNFYHNMEEPSFTGWLEYFTEGFLSSAKVLRATVRILAVSTKPLEEAERLSLEDSDILSYVAQFGSIRLAEAEAVLPRLSRRSVQRKLQDLVAAGYLVTKNGGRSTVYVMKK